MCLYSPVFLYCTCLRLFLLPLLPADTVCRMCSSALLSRYCMRLYSFLCFLHYQSCILCSVSSPCYRSAFLYCSASGAPCHMYSLSLLRFRTLCIPSVLLRRILCLLHNHSQSRSCHLFRVPYSLLPSYYTFRIPFFC